MMHPPTNSLTIIALARNESRHIEACFTSLEPLTKLPQTDTLIILDSRADRATYEAAHRAANRVVVWQFVNFSAQRNKGLQEASGKWVFFIDPDERCTPKLAKEILYTIEQDGNPAYGVPRRNFFFGHEVRHTGWWPDYQMRLLQRARCHYDESRAVHEVPTTDGDTGNLIEPLIHYNYDTWRQFIRKQWAYAPFEAKALYAEGRRARPLNIVGQPLRELKRRAVDYEGYKDGLLGLALSAAMALYTAETYRQLWLLQRHGQA